MAAKTIKNRVVCKIILWGLLFMLPSFLALTAVPSEAAALDTSNLENLQIYNVSPYMEFYMDPTGELAIQDITSEYQNSFRAHGRPDAPNYSYTDCCLGPLFNKRPRAPKTMVDGYLISPVKPNRPVCAPGWGFQPAEQYKFLSV